CHLFVPIHLNGYPDLARIQRLSSVRTLLHQVSLLSLLHQFRRQFLELLLPILTGIVPSPVLHSPLTAPSWYHGLRFSHDARRSPCLSLPLNLMPMGAASGCPTHTPPKARRGTAGGERT